MYGSLYASNFKEDLHHFNRCTQCYSKQKSHLVTSITETWFKRTKERTNQRKRLVQYIYYITHQIKKTPAHTAPNHTIHTGYSLKLDSLSSSFHFKASMERKEWTRFLHQPCERSQAGYFRRDPFNYIGEGIYVKTKTPDNHQHESISSPAVQQTSQRQKCV